MCLTPQIKVKLVDIEPADLITRLQAGKVYRDGQAQRSWVTFYSRKFSGFAGDRTSPYSRPQTGRRRNQEKMAARAGETYRDLFIQRAV